MDKKEDILFRREWKLSNLGFKVNWVFHSKVNTNETDIYWYYLI